MYVEIRQVGFAYPPRYAIKRVGFASEAEAEAGASCSFILDNVYEEADLWSKAASEAVVVRGSLGHILELPLGVAHAAQEAALAVLREGQSRLPNDGGCGDSRWPF